MARLAIAVAGLFALIETMLSATYGGFAYDFLAFRIWPYSALCVGTASLPVYCSWFLYRRFATLLFLIATFYVCTYWAATLLLECSTHHCSVGSLAANSVRQLGNPFLFPMLITSVLMTFATVKRAQ